MNGVYENLPAGTYLRDGQGHFIRVISMQGTMAYCERVKRDGSRDQRTRGWSGSLLIERWHPAALKDRGR
jgi:hypothetical protein